MIIRGNRIKITPLSMEDAQSMRSWGTHETVLLRDYNFPYEGDREIKKWFRYKTFTIFNKYFGVHNEEGILVGYLGIKNKDFFRRSSFFGIVFDPNHLGKGYGTESLEIFLPYYFNEMKMKTLYLEVAEFNKRAIHLYEKFGFVTFEYYTDLFPVEGIDRSHPEIMASKSYFVFKDEKIYNYIYKMKLTKKRFRGKEGQVKGMIRE
ncbi:GNAT family N-acetyltransferase [Gudongella sp. DL1XJH-153]|uniref:GNAT family N-acetyltransferase n=1 Tax=Gudongella sp. DL1XJH-153 TaxID=3409804 RepID=UPI003BB502AF